MSFKNRPSFGFTGDGRLVTATSGIGIHVKAGTEKTAELLLKKKQAQLRRRLYK